MEQGAGHQSRGVLRELREEVLKLRQLKCLQNVERIRSRALQVKEGTRDLDRAS